MPASAPALDKSAATIRDMFGGVAPRYDLLNRVLSGRLDVLWRRRAAGRLDGVSGRILDLCCGTGDQALALGRSDRRGAGRQIAAADFCLPMLALARRKYQRVTAQRPAGLAADALELPFPAGHFAAATVAFGLRNLADLDPGLREIRRVLAPGGCLVALEFALPPRPLLRRLYLVYFRLLLPRLGALLSPRAAAYTYLPDSVLDFPQRAEFAARLRAAGFATAGWSDLTFGTVCLYEARCAP